MSSLEKRADVAPTSVRPGRISPHRSAEAAARLRKRQRAETLFQWLGKGAIAIGLGFVVILFATIVWQGQSAITQTHVRLDITFDPTALGLAPNPSHEQLAQGDYAALIRNALSARFPGITERSERRSLGSIMSSGAPYELAEMLEGDPSLLGQTRSVWLTADVEIDMLIKGNIRRDTPSAERRLKAMDRNNLPPPIKVQLDASEPISSLPTVAAQSPLAMLVPELASSSASLGWGYVY